MAKSRKVPAPGCREPRIANDDRDSRIMGLGLYVVDDVGDTAVRGVA